MSLGLPPTTELIETMRLNRQGQVLLLPLHLQRIALSARKLGFTWSQSAALTALALTYISAISKRSVCDLA